MKKITVTIGIPAHNEEKNIEKLLHSIFSQDNSLYSLQSVIVGLDGCTDNSYIKIKKLKNIKIKSVISNTRYGKSNMLNKMYKLNRSDIFITFDADVLLQGKNVINEIVKGFNNKKVGLVGANALPSKPKTFIEKIAVTWIHAWYETRKSINNGNTIHNHLGCGTAMRNEICNNLSLPIVVAEDDYIYIYVQKQKYNFALAENAVVNYRTVTNFKDFLMQNKRLFNGRNEMENIFNENLEKYYKVPGINKILGLYKTGMHSPFYLCMAIIFQIISRIYNKVSSTNTNNLWNPVLSTKNISN